MASLCPGGMCHYRIDGFDASCGHGSMGGHGCLGGRAATLIATISNHACQQHGLGPSGFSWLSWLDLPHECVQLD